MFTSVGAGWVGGGGVATTLGADGVNVQRWVLPPANVRQRMRATFERHAARQLRSTACKRHRTV